MSIKRGIPLLAAALLCAVVALAMVGRDKAPALPKPRGTPRARPPVVDVSIPEERPLLPPPGPTEAVEQARVFPLYQDFRAAVATGNPQILQAARGRILPHRDVALTLAEQDLATSPDDTSRSVAFRTLEALRR